MSTPETHSRIAFTICTANHLPRALTLADSMTAHAPDFSFFIVLIDPLTSAVDSIVGDDHHIIPVDDLKVAFLDELTKRYDPAEVSFVLKPVAFRHFFDRFPQSRFAVYFDSDVMIYHPLHRIEVLLGKCDVVLTPHLLSPSGFDGKTPSEFGTLRTGYFNMGFVAIANTPSVGRLIDWWRERMRCHGHENRALGLSADQFWMTFAPFFFDRIFIDRHPGMNVAYWNLHERNLSDSDGRIIVNGEFPLIFIHFSGFDPKKPHHFCDPLFFNRFNSTHQPVFGHLAEQYAGSLLARQYDALSGMPSSLFSKQKQLAARIRESRCLSTKMQYALVYLMAKTPTRLRRWLRRLAVLFVSHTRY